MDDLSHGEMAYLKRAVHSLITVAKVAEGNGNVGEAFTIYLDALTLSYRIIQGGLVLDYRNGISLKVLVLTAIADVTPKLSPNQAERVLLTLNRLEKDQESIRAIALRERGWRRTVLGHGLRITVEAIVRTRSLYPEVSSIKARGVFEQRLRSTQAKLLTSVQSNSSGSN